MSSTVLYFGILFVAGILFEETSAIMGRVNAGKIFGKRRWVPRHREPPIVREARTVFEDAKSHVRFNLAPSYGTLNSNTLQQLDESLKVVMGAILEMDMYEGLTWKDFKLALDTNPLMIRQPYNYVSKLERLSFNSVRLFGLGSQKKLRKMSIRTWFGRLVGNVDILKDTDIDLDSLINMVSNISVDMINNLWTHKSKKTTLMDLGILRFPDISQPFFTLYRINLMVKCTYKTFLLHQREKSDVIGLFEKQVYYPDREYIEGLNEDLIDQLLSEVDDLFSDF